MSERMSDATIILKWYLKYSFNIPENKKSCNIKVIVLQKQWQSVQYLEIWKGELTLILVQLRRL
jgi:hypothetical protein